MPELRVERLVHVYRDGGVRALDGINLVIRPGERVAIVGQNGSGKTTLVRHLNGLLRPTEGRVLHDGRDIADSRVAVLAATVGVVFQDPDRQIFAGRVVDEVAFGPRMLGRSREDVDRAVDEALDAVGLRDVAGHNPYDLGYSRRKLLALASVLAMETPILVIDEPTTGQDVRGIARVQSVIGDVNASGRTVIVVTHDMRFVAETFDRVVVMGAGQIRLQGAPDEVFAEPAWPTLSSTFLEPPLAARIGAGLGLGPTPTESGLVDALAGASGPPGR